MKANTLLIHPTALRRLWAMACASVLLLALALPAPAGNDKDQPGKHRPIIFPPKSRPYGKSYSEWNGAWWRWAYSFPAGEDKNPVQDLTGELADLGQSGPVWFLAGSFGKTLTRTATVPSDKALFFPIINSLWINIPELGDNPWSDEQRDFARDFIAPMIDNAFDLSCQIDGIEVMKLERYRTATRDGKEYMVTIPENNVAGLPLPAGAYGPTVDDGISLMLAPLKVGKHTIRFTAASQGSFAGDFALDVTYHLKVVRPARIVPPDATAYGKTLTEWLGAYWRWYYGGADPDQSKVGHVQLMPLPAGDQISGTGTPADPALYRGQLEITLPPGTPFVLPAFAWVGERYDGYPAEADDPPVSDSVLLGGVHPDFTINGLTVMSDANKADFYVPTTLFDPMVVYPTPTSYGSVAALFYQGCGFVCRPLPPGRHVIHLYEPYILAPGAYPPIPDGFGQIFDNTWIVTVSPD